MVACMPACSSFARYYFDKFRVVNFIKGQFSSLNSESVGSENSDRQTLGQKLGSSRAAVHGIRGETQNYSEERKFSRTSSFLVASNLDEEGDAPHIPKRQGSRSSIKEMSEFATFDSLEHSPTAMETVTSKDWSSQNSLRITNNNEEEKDLVNSTILPKRFQLWI